MLEEACDTLLYWFKLGGLRWDPSEFFQFKMYNEFRRKSLILSIRTLRLYSSGKSHHETLGLPNDATSQEIKERYLFLAKQLHPDTAVKDGSKTLRELTEEFTRVKEAYESLKSEEQRAKQ